MKKKIETNIVRRDRYYFVILRQYRKLFGFRIWEGPWRETAPRFLSRAGAEALACHIKDYLLGRYEPKSAK